MPVLSNNIAVLTNKNNNYRKVINTTPTQQLVLMSLKPGEFIHLEIHPKTTQFIRIEKGTGVVEIGKPVKKKIKVKDDTSVTIPPNTWHFVENTSKTKTLKLYTIYSPPHHKPGTIQKRQPKETH
jgi:mannose-6-phosphate isomerase-like protein (cupin superfamily)